MKGSDWHTVPDIKKWAINIVDFACPRLYIHRFSMLATPLNTLVAHCAKGGKFYWNNEHKAVFNALVDAVCTALVLWQPWFEDQFTINCDASTYAIGAVLQQGDEKGKLHPVTFLF